MRKQLRKNASDSKTEKAIARWTTKKDKLMTRIDTLKEACKKHKDKLKTLKKQMNKKTMKRGGEGTGEEENVVKLKIYYYKKYDLLEYKFDDIPYVKVYKETLNYINALTEDDIKSIKTYLLFFYRLRETNVEDCVNAKKFFYNKCRNKRYMYKDELKQILGNLGFDSNNLNSEVENIKNKYNEGKEIIKEITDKIKADRGVIDDNIQLSIDKLKAKDAISIDMNDLDNSLKGYTFEKEFVDLSNPQDRFHSGYDKTHTKYKIKHDGKTYTFKKYDGENNNITINSDSFEKLVKFNSIPYKLYNPTSILKEYNKINESDTTELNW